MNENPNYSLLREVLERAYQQSESGKGKERHANDKAFERQPILEIGRMVGPGYEIGQAMKKGQEAFGMFTRLDFDRAVAELLGTIVYAAGAIVLIEEIARDNAAKAKPADTTGQRAVRDPEHGRFVKADTDPAQRLRDIASGRPVMGTVTSLAEQAVARATDPTNDRT